MRMFFLGPAGVLLVVVVGGCPMRPQSEEPAVETTSEPEHVVAPAAPTSPSQKPAQQRFRALREARGADLPILTPVLEYLSSSAVDEEISGLKDMRWLCLEDVQNGIVSDEDPDNMTVIYRIVDQENRIAVQVGPPKSEFDLEFHVARKGVGEYMYVGWQPLAGAEEE